MLQFSLRSAAALVYLHDYSVLLPESIATLEQREQVLAGVHMLTDELREKHAALEKLASSSGGPAAPPGSAAAVAQERKIQQLQAQVVQLQVGRGSVAVLWLRSHGGVGDVAAPALHLASLQSDATNDIPIQPLCISLHSQLIHPNPCTLQPTGPAGGRPAALPAPV